MEIESRDLVGVVEVEDAPQVPNVGYRTLMKEQGLREENVVGVVDIGFTHM